jgi:hypothetical protein
VILGFRCDCNKGKIFFVLSKLFNAKNKSASKSVGKVFFMIKIGPGFYGFTCLLSHKVVVALSASWMTETST